jgi:Ca2+-transporting ATPase
MGKTSAKDIAQARSKTKAGDTPSTWHTQDAAEALRRLGTRAERGLEAREAAKRLEEHGPNELIERGVQSVLRIIAEQFVSLMVLLLIAAAAVSGLLLGEWEDALVILVIVVLNALLGFWQEFRAEKALAALKSMSAPKVRVLRDARVREVPARELVPGDIVLIEAGNFIPADCRLIESANLKVREAALTGEAEAVAKEPAALQEQKLPLGDRKNMLYMGTVATYGRATAVVTATGMSGELGNIATLIQETAPEKTVLQKKLASLSVVLVFSALGLIALVALEGWILQGQGFKELFITAVSMAVAAIPEGLPAVVTIALALGAQRMLRRRALIRKLPAVETLGSVTVICSDKTGTLTQNRMTVTVLDLLGRRVELPPEDLAGSERAGIAEDPHVSLLLTAAALCSDAVLEEKGAGEEQKTLQTIGDPTEGALVRAAARNGLPKPRLEELLPRIGELPFDSHRKRMSTVHSLAGVLSASTPAASRSPRTGDSSGSKQLAAGLAQILAPWIRELQPGPGDAPEVVFTKGAVDSLLEVCSSVWQEGVLKSLSEKWRRGIRDANDDLAAQGIRVLGVAFKKVGSDRSPDRWEQELAFVGMIGMLDPLRTEVRDAVETCRRAGIRPVMITGDHPLIARTIAGQLGLDNADRVLSGMDLADMKVGDLRQQVEQVSVYARVAPEHKLKIVDALQEKGHIVAMTGDGVNDAPALKSADIGVAMGITGTDVSKEAAAMVLQDDNFATIVAAVEEGRVIFDNILRFVRYILASNWAEILVMLLAPLFGLPIPLFPVQILWMNLVTDGLPALALGVEPGEKDVMVRAPREPERPILTWNTGAHILWVGALMAAVALWVGGSQYGRFGAALSNAFTNSAAWRTMLFTTLVFSQLTLGLAERSRRSSLFQIGLLSNKYMLAAVALTFCLQIAVVYLPFLQGFFSTVALSAAQVGICFVSSLIMLLAVEIEKLLVRLTSSPSGRQ